MTSDLARPGRLERRQGAEGVPDEVDRSRHRGQHGGHVLVLAAQPVVSRILAGAVTARVERVHGA